ncbi:hypothetical protein AgCh_027165 [Apium graveolens]
MLCSCLQNRSKSHAAVKDKIDAFMLNTPTSDEITSVKTIIKGVVQSQHSMDSRLSSLEDKVSSIADKLDALFSFLSNTDAKKGEKIVATNCIPDYIQIKDKDIDDDGQGKSTGAHKAKHKTTTDALEADDVTISNLVDAKGLFFPYRYKETGEEIILCYKDKRFEKKNARSALGSITEEFPDLTAEEAVMQQKELMAQIEAEANTFKGRGKRCGRSTRARGRGGRGRTSKPIQVTAFNSAFLNVLSREGYVPVQGHEGAEEVQKPEELTVQRKKRSAIDIDQDDTTNQNVTLEADTNPEVKADPDVVNLIADFDSDEKVIKALNALALTTVVTPHNSEVDEKERVDRRKADQACKDYVQRGLTSKGELWHKTKGKIRDLSTSYAPLSKKDKRWKDIYTFDYPKGFKHVEFVSAGLRDSISEQEDVDKSIKKPSWIEYNEKLKLIKTRTRGGIGHSEMEVLRSDLLDTNTMTDNLGERISPSHLEKVEAVKIVYRKINDNDVREEILYFLRDGKVKCFTLQQLLMKTVTELKYIHYLLRVENSVTRNWSSMILEVIRRRVMTKDDKYNGDYIPMYRTYTGQEMKMKKGVVVLKVFLNSPQLSFSPDHENVSLSFMLIGDLEINKSSISKLRSTIYQFGEDTEEKRELKKKHIKVLQNKEEERLKNFLETTVSYLKILK